MTQVQLRAVSCWRIACLLAIDNVWGGVAPSTQEAGCAIVLGNDIVCILILSRLCCVSGNVLLTVDGQSIFVVNGHL